MGKYDKFLVGISSAPAPGQAPSKKTGKYSQYTAGLDTPRQNADLRKPTFGEIYDARKDFSPPALIKSKILEPGGEKIAELGGRFGYPKTGAAVGTVVSELPAFVSAAAGLIDLYGKDPSTLSKAVRNTPRMLSPKYSELKEGLVSGDLPERAGRVARFPNLGGQPSLAPPPQAPMVSPKSYPKELNSFLNFVKARVNSFGKKLSAQELDDYHTELQTILADTRLKGTAPYAVAQGLKKLVDPLRGGAIPGINELDKVYALSKKLRVAPEIAKKIWNYLGPKARWGVIGVP